MAQAELMQSVEIEVKTVVLCMMTENKKMDGNGTELTCVTLATTTTGNSSGSGPCKLQVRRIV